MQSRAQFAMWAVGGGAVGAGGGWRFTSVSFVLPQVMAAPLTISGNLLSPDPFVLETYLNAEVGDAGAHGAREEVRRRAQVIAVDQDPLGRQGFRMWGSDLTVAVPGVWPLSGAHPLCETVCTCRRRGAVADYHERVGQAPLGRLMGARIH